MENQVIVHTKEELESAQKSGAQEIIIKGDLAEKVRNGKKILTIGKFTLIALTAAIAAIPITGGISSVALAPIVALTSLEIAAIAAIFFVGIALLMAVWNEYDEIEFSTDPPTLKIRKKS